MTRLRLSPSSIPFTWIYASLPKKRLFIPDPAYFEYEPSEVLLDLADIPLKR